MLPKNTAKLLIYLGYSAETDFEVATNSVGETVVSNWFHADPQPTETEINTAAASPEFATWLEEHGGDPVKTLRRQAREALNAQRAEDLRTRAALVEIVKEFNRHADKINSILDAMDAATSLADLKTRIGAIADYPQRTPAQLRTLIVNAINAGEADT